MFQSLNSHHSYKLAFNHSFDSLSQEVDLDRHLATGLVQSRATLIMDTLRFWLPILRKLVSLVQIDFNLTFIVAAIHET